METVSASIVARGVAEYGILGLGWILFLFSMIYIRSERARYQDLVIHIITYFTKVNMLEGRHDDPIPLPPSFFPNPHSPDNPQRRTRSKANQPHRDDSRG